MQQSRFIALVSNGKRLREVANAAENADDAGLIQYSKTLDSLESKQANLKTSFQQFYMDILNGDFFKGIISGVTTLLDGLNKLGNFTKITSLISLIKSLKTVLNITFNGAANITQPLVVAFKRAYQEILSESTNFGRQLPGAIQTGQQQGQLTQTVGQVTRNTTETNNQGGKIARFMGSSKGQLIMNGVAVAANIGGAMLSGSGDAATGSIGTAIGNIASGATTGAMIGSVIPGIGTAWGTAIGALVSALSSIPGIVEAFSNRTQEIVDNAKKTAEEKNIDRAEKQTKYKDLKSTIENLESLREKMNLSEEDYQAYIDASNAAVESYPELFGYLDSEGNSIVDLSDKYILLAQAKEAAGKAGMESAEANLELSQAEYNKAVKDYQDAQDKRISGYSSASIDYALQATGADLQSTIDEWQQLGEVTTVMSSAAKRYAQGHRLSNTFGYEQVASVLMKGATEDTYSKLGLDDIYSSNTDLFRLIKNFTDNKTDVTGQDMADFIIANAEFLRDYINLDEVITQLSDGTYSNYSDWIAATSTQKIDTAQRSIELDQKALIGSKVYSRTLGLDDDTALVAINAANSIMQQALLSAFKASDYTDVDKWLTEDKSNYQETWNEVQGALDSFYSTLGETSLNSFNDFLNNSAKYSEGQFAQSLQEQFGVGEDEPIYKILNDYFTNTYKTAYNRFDQGIADLNKDSAVKFVFKDTGYYDYNLRDIGSEYYDDVLAQAQQINRLLESGKLTTDQAYAAWVRYAQTVDAVNKLTNPNKRIKWMNRIIQGTDWTSATDVFKLQTEMSESGISEIQNAAGFLDGYDGNMVINLVTEWNNLSDAISSQAEKYAEALSNATSGMDTEKALEMAKKVGGDLSDFELIDGKWFFTDIEKLKEAYTKEADKSKELIEGWQESTLTAVDNLSSVEELQDLGTGEITPDKIQAYKNQFTSKTDALAQYNAESGKAVDENDAAFLDWYNEKAKVIDLLTTYFDSSTFSEWAAKPENSGKGIQQYMQEVIQELGASAKAIMGDYYAYLEEQTTVAATIQATLGKTLVANKKADALKTFAGNGPNTTLESISSLFTSMGVADEALLTQLKGYADEFGNLSLSGKDFAKIVAQSNLGFEGQKLAIQLFNNAIQSTADNLISAASNLSDTAAEKTVGQADLEEMVGTTAYEKLSALDRRIFEKAVNGAYSDEATTTLLTVIAKKMGVEGEENISNFTRNLLERSSKLTQKVLSTSADIISGEFIQADVDKLDAGEYKNKVQKFLKDVQNDLQGAVNSLLADTRKALEDHDISYSDAKSTASAAFKRALDYDAIVNQFGESFSDIAKEYTIDQIEGLDSAYEKLSTSAEGISTSDLVDALADIYLTFGEKVSQYYRNALQLGEDGKYRLNVGKLEENLSSISDVAGARAYSERIIEQAKISVQAATEDYMSSVSSALEQAASGEKMSVSDAQSLLDKMGLRQTQEAIATLTSGSLESILNYLVGQMDLAVSAGIIDASIVQEKYTEIIQLILDAIRDSLSSNLDALGKGVSGELTNSEFLSLAKQYGLNSRGNISSYKGITLGSQNQQALIAKMSRQVQDTFGLTGVGEFGQELWNLWQNSDNPLYKSYQDAEDAAKEAFAAAQAMGDATGEAAQEAWSYAQALQAAASAAKESADSAEFDFMGQDPFANRQQEHWTQLVDNIDTFKSSLQSFAKSGEMGVKDFYNIIDQIDRLGQAGSFLSNVGQDEWLKSGQTIQDWANKVVAASETIGKVDAKGFVDVGIDISAAASSMATRMTDGLKEVAKQQIDYLNGIEQMLLAMQSLEDIGDVKLNLGIGIDVDGDGKGETIETYRDLVDFWNANKDNEDVKKELQFVLGVAWDKGNAGLTDIANRLNTFGQNFGFDEDKFFESMFFTDGKFNPEKFLIGSDFFVTMSDLGAEGIQGMLDLLASDMRKAGLDWEFKDGKAIFTDPAAAQKFFLDLFGDPTKFVKLLNQQANLEQYSKMLSEAGGKAIGNIKLQDGNATVDRQIKLTPGSLILVDDEGNELTGESLVDYINENANNRMVVEDYLNSVYGASLESDQSYIVDVGEETVTYRIGTKIERKIADITGTDTDETIPLPSGTITLTVEEGQLKVEGPKGAPLSDELRKEAEDQLTKDLGKPITISDTGNVTYTVFDSVEVSLNKIVATLQSISDLMSGDAFKLDFSNLDTEPLNAISTALSTISTSALGLAVVAASMATIASNAGTAESKLNGVAGELDAIAGKNKDINVNFTINGIDLISSALQFLLGNMSAENATVETTFSAKDENVDKTAKDVTSSVESVPSSHETSFSGIVGNIISVVERVKKIIAEIPKSVNTSFTGTVSVKKTGGKPLAPSGAGLNVDLPYYTGNVDGKALVNGQTYGAALAGKTLVGELGPELAVYDNKYHLLGEDGAEFVNLPSDAIVFNHLQTQGIIDGKVDKIRGTQLNAAYKHASMYSGNALVEGNAYAGGIGSALAAVRRAKSIWTNLLNSLSAADMLGGGGGGGGGGGKNASLKPYIADLQEWYNLSRQIVDLENRINTLVAQRNNLSKGFDQGAAYLRNLKESQALLEDQLNTQRDLYRYQQDELKRQADAINDSSNWISKFYKVGADGVLQYVEGNETNGGKGALEVLQELNNMGDNPERYTIKDQVAWIEKVTNGQFKRGFTWEEGQTEDENGKTVGNGEYTKKEWTDEEYVQEFFSALQEPIDDYDGLRDSVQETEEKLESLAEEIQKVNDEIRDNEIEVSQMIYDAIVQVKEKVIKDLKESNKLITDANKAYADSIQNAITKEKNQYSTNQNISERETLQRQLSLLRRSGGSASEIQSLEKTISEKLKDEYFQKQEDALEVIKDANTKQTELMEQQVQLLQDTLDYEKENGVLWTKAYEIMDQGNAFMLDFLSGAGADSFLEKANLEQKKMLEEWAFKIGLYSENERSTMLSNKYAEPAFETLKNNTSDTSKWKEGYKNVYDSVDAATRTGWDRDYLDTYNSYMLKNVNGQSSNEQIAAAQKEASRLAEQSFFEHIAQEKKRREDNEKAKNQSNNSSGGGSSGSSSGGSSPSSKSSGTGYYYITMADGTKIGVRSNDAKSAASYLNKKAAQAEEKGGTVERNAAGNAVVRGSGASNSIPNQYKKNYKVTKRKTGGSATNTGLYMLHGTQENPEYILNASQTRGLEQLVSFTQKNPDFVNVLKAHYDSFAGNLASQNYTTSNSNSINISDGAIQISVAKLNDSYDIEDISNDIMDRMYSIAAKSSSRSVSRR